MKSLYRLLTFQISALVAVTGLARASYAQSIEKFDGPGSSETYPYAVNEFGMVVGEYVDANRHHHGFVRSPFGTFKTFDAPPVGEEALDSGTVSTVINTTGQIAGSIWGMVEGALIERGFVRNEFGTVTEFDAAPGALRTEPEAINLFGWIAGTFRDASFVAHGFVRSPQGTITTFDQADFFGPVRAIRPNGDVIGVYLQQGGTFRGFVRQMNGTISSFDAPELDPQGSGVFCPHCGGTLPTAVSLSGRTVGYFAAPGHTVRGFMRKADGTFSMLDVPGAVQTQPEAINLEGAVAGEYRDAESRHGFLLTRDGALEPFDVPDAYGIYVTALDSDSRVIGYFADSSGTHGFVRKPRAVCGRFHF